ncbi:MAG: ABC transporter permease [Acidimicrobiales bacterium]
MRQLLALTVTDLVQRVRDRSVIIFALVVPLALMFVFNSVFGAVEAPELEAVTVAVAAPAGDEMAAVIPEVVRSLDGEALAVTVEEVDEPAARALVENGDAAVALLVPEGFGAAARTGAPVTLEAVRGDQDGIETDIVLSVVEGVLEQFAAGAVTGRAALAEGVPPAQLDGLAEQAAMGGPAYELAAGEAASEQLGAGASLVAGQAGLFLLFTVSFGVTALLVERETGTLARLRSMPMPGWYIVTSKALVSLVLGVVATSVLLTAGGVLFDADFGSPVPVALLILCATTAGTSSMFLVARVAKTSEQAGIASSIVALVLGIGGGAFMPISASGALATVLDLNPVAAFIRGLGITSAGGGITDLGLPIAIMLGFAVITVGLSRLVPDRGALS